MPEYSNYQRKVIERYYERKDEIMLTRLSELVSDLYLADTDKKRDALWKRVETAMNNLKVPASIAAHILKQRKPELLAAHVNDWLKQARGK
ncbi:MAG: hypothetical protein HUU22_17970 [Phycisphaerae bacterium]|nr:hypothetical protein [Phycisphaerae bacterium]NUQ47909.1 hypothetical protein [Phycisphaerae bacterium]